MAETKGKATTKTKAKKNYAPAKSTYERITEDFMRQLKQGIIPWNKPWMVGAKNGTELHYKGAYSIDSGKTYSLYHQLTLPFEGAYGTYNNWAKLFGVGEDGKQKWHIKRGEHPYTVCYVHISDKTIVEEDEDGEEVEKKEKRFLLKHYNVYHFTQLAGIEEEEVKRLIEEKKERWEKRNLLSAEKEAALIASKGDRCPELEEDLALYYERFDIEVMEDFYSDRAYYVPALDRICLPKITQFKTMAGFYATKCHETIHSTGHSTRLGRDFGEKFGSEEYSKEELVAEIGSYMLMNLYGVSTEDSNTNSVAYVQNWLTRLVKLVKEEGDKFIHSAMKGGRDAANFIMETAEWMKEVEEEEEIERMKDGERGTEEDNPLIA